MHDFHTAGGVACAELQRCLRLLATLRVHSVDQPPRFLDVSHTGSLRLRFAWKDEAHLPFVAKARTEDEAHPAFVAKARTEDEAHPALVVNARTEDEAHPALVAETRSPDEAVGPLWLGHGAWMALSAFMLARVVTLGVGTKVWLDEMLSLPTRPLR